MTPGQEVVAWLVEGERQVEWWLRYSGRLTPEERKTIRNGNYRSFRRELPPAFRMGDWLDVTPKLRIRIGEVSLRKGSYRCTIDKLEDFRTTTVYMPNYREDVDAMGNTLDVRRGANPPEPEGVEKVWLDRFAEEASRKMGEFIREAIER